MSWVKLHDRIDEDPKILSVPVTARWLYICGLAYCGRMETDGFVPSAAVARIGADIKNLARCVTDLLTAELWVTVPGGYRIPTWLRYNRSAEQLANERRASAERMAKVRPKLRSNNGAKFNGPVPVPDPEEVQEPPAEPGESWWHTEQIAGSHAQMLDRLTSAVELTQRGYFRLLRDHPGSLTSSLQYARDAEERGERIKSLFGFLEEVCRQRETSVRRRGA